MPSAHRVSRFGWVALAASVVVAVAICTAVWLLARSDSGNTLPVSLIDPVWYTSLFAAILGLPTLIILDTMAASRGRGNQLAGIAGGVAMLLTFPAVFLLLPH